MYREGLIDRDPLKPDALSVVAHLLTIVFLSQIYLHPIFSYNDDGSTTDLFLGQVMAGFGYLVLTLALIAMIINTYLLYENPGEIRFTLYSLGSMIIVLFLMENSRSRFAFTHDITREIGSYSTWLAIISNLAASLLEIEYFRGDKT